MAANASGERIRRKTIIANLTMNIIAAAKNTNAAVKVNMVPIKPMTISFPVPAPSFKSQSPAGKLLSHW